MELEEMIHAATLFQSLWRSSVTHKEFLLIQSCATVIQRHVRGWFYHDGLSNNYDDDVMAYLDYDPAMDYYDYNNTEDDYEGDDDYYYPYEKPGYKDDDAAFDNYCHYYCFNGYDY
jgi:IQ calmodulin-binding motif